MKFEQLEQLVKIKECGSISKAAVELHVAQSTLSTSVKNLEEELGCKLIERANKGVTLTSAGTEVYNQSKAICEMVYNMKKSISGETDEDKVLSVSNNYSIIGKDMFIALYNKYSGKHCKFRIQEASVSEAIENVASGVSEIGLVRFPEDNRDMHLRTMKRQGVEYHRMSLKRMCVVIGEKNPFYNMEANTIKLEYLTQFPFAGYYDEESDVIFEKLLPRTKRLKENISIGSVDHLKEVIRNTDAFTLDVYKEKEFNSEWYEGVRYIPITPTIWCEFGWIKKKERELSPIADEYIHDLDRHFKEFWKDRDDIV